MSAEAGVGQIPEGETRAARLGVAIIGAGISGLVCARTLADRGHRVRVFDKSRGPGGRMSTRRAAGWRFDHGAQYFTVRDPAFEQSVAGWMEEGVVSRWAGKIAVLADGTTLTADRGNDRLVAVPGMNSVCRSLAANLDVIFETRVETLRRVRGRWRLSAAEGGDLGGYDAVVVSAPAPQTAALLENAAPHLAARASGVEMAPCWAAMVAFADPLNLGFDGAFVHRSPLSWIARNASKPGRSRGETWVLHASPEWSHEHLELERAEAAERILAAFSHAVGGIVPSPLHLDAHRWRFALPIDPLEDPCLFDADLRLAACGDWCGGPRVEGAFLSGSATAGRLLGRLPL